MFDVYSIDSDKILVARLNGILDITTAERLVDFVEIKEARVETGFNRFCDMSRLMGIRVSTTGIADIAARRRNFNPNQIRVKSAFLAPTLLAFGIASVYKQLLRSPRIEVQVWDNMQAAADWLGVSPEKLTL